MYPVMLDLEGKRCLVVGGGGVAARKVEGLLADGARVVIVADQPAQSLVDLAERGEVDLQRRPYRPGEAAGEFALVFAATDDRDINRQVFEDADGAGIWANVADDPELCSFHLPARIRRGAFQLAVASAGEAPFVVRRMRQLLERRFGPEWAEWADAAARFRSAVREADMDRVSQERCFDRFFQATVDGARIRARVPSGPEEQTLLGVGGQTACADPEPGRPRPCDPDQPEQVGFVSLVGAGPGDPGLLTVKGRQRLVAADAVVYDRLAVTALPADLPAAVELHPVGKRAKHHPLAQEEINALLVRLAKECKRVVRLKGGDPFVFGRGGEEGLALVEAGVPFEVIPAVTAGVAVPAYAGIPVTHRNVSVRLTLVTAHESIKSGGPQVRWDLLAQDPHATLVGYMGVTSLPEVTRKLLAAGMPEDTPAALIQRGTSPVQRRVVSTIAKLHADGQLAGIKPPAVFVVGPTVAFAERLDWFANRPLFGQRLVLPAPAGRLGEALDLAGAEVVELPLPVGEAGRTVLHSQPVTGCLLRDLEEVEALEEERDGAGFDARTIAWCLDEHAADRARELGWLEVQVLSRQATAANLVGELQRRLSESLK